MNNKDKYFCLYACCIIVKGVKKNIICDLQRNAYKEIDSPIIDLIEVLNCDY